MDNLLDIPLGELLSMSVTSASRKNTKLSTAPAAIDVITNKDIKRSSVYWDEQNTILEDINVSK